MKAIISIRIHNNERHTRVQITTINFVKRKIQTAQRSHKF